MCVRYVNMREYVRLCVLCVVRTSLALSHTCCLTAARLHRVQEPLSVFTKPTFRVKSLLDKEDVKHLSLHILDFRVVSRKILLAIVARDKFLDSDTPDRLLNSPLPPEIGCLPSHVIKWVLHNSYVRIQDSQTACSGTAE